MHKGLVAVQQAIAEIIDACVANPAGAPDPSEIASVAIQNAGPRPSDEFMLRACYRSVAAWQDTKLSSS